MSTGYVKVRVYAQRYDVSPKTVRKWIAAGLVVAVRIGRLVRVRDVAPRGGVLAD